MRWERSLLAVATIAMVWAAGAEPSTAQPYPFCRNGEAGPGDCRYDTLAQCQAAISGTAGYCQPNYFLPAPDQSHSPRRRARRS